MERTELIEALSGLTEKQFLELFYEVANNRRDQTAYDKYHLTLGATWLIGTPDRNGKKSLTWYSEFLCVANPVEYPHGWSDDAVICQSGACSVCGNECLSYAKEAICAVCDNPVGLT